MKTEEIKALFAEFEQASAEFESVECKGIAEIIGLYTMAKL